MRVKVTAPYVTIKTVAGTDGPAVRGFYDGAIVDDVSEGDVEHLLRKGMVEVVEEPEPEPVKEPSVKDILAAVGDDSEAAKAALEAEQERSKPRKSLVEGLEAVIAAAAAGAGDGSGGDGSGTGNSAGDSTGDGK